MFVYQFYWLMPGGINYPSFKFMCLKKMWLYQLTFSTCLPQITFYNAYSAVYKMNNHCISSLLLCHCYTITCILFCVPYCKELLQGNCSPTHTIRLTSNVLFSDWVVTIFFKHNYYFTILLFALYMTIFLLCFLVIWKMVRKWKWRTSVFKTEEKETILVSSQVPSNGLKVIKSCDLIGVIITDLVNVPNVGNFIVKNWI